jgi:CobQ/CobB/MinD/ParA nucleotide binding domain
MSVFLVHGDKGGVGKSFLAAVLIEYLRARGHGVAVVDADTRNADLHALYGGGEYPTLRVDLRREDGWMEFASFLESTPHNDVVVSLPAGVGDDVTLNHRFFADALYGLRRSLVAFWLLNRSPHAVALLRPFVQCYADDAKAMVAVRNLFFGEPHRFARWNDAKTREAFLAAGGLEMDLDDLHERIVDATFLHLPPRRFTDDAHLNYGERLALRRWLERTFAGLDALGERLGAGTR